VGTQHGCLLSAEVVENPGRTQEGSKLIVVDPRRNEVAKEADQWLRVKPATDDALALGWLNVIIKEKLYDEPFVPGLDERALPR